jgi:tryptophan 7-halogenase
MALFQSRRCITLAEEELFSVASWLAVFYGQNIVPQRYDPLADQKNPDELQGAMREIRRVLRGAIEAMPSHEDFIASCCLAEAL